MKYGFKCDNTDLLDSRTTRWAESWPACSQGDRFEIAWGCEMIHKIITPSKSRVTHTPIEQLEKHQSLIAFSRYIYEHSRHLRDKQHDATQPLLVSSLRTKLHSVRNHKHELSVYTPPARKKLQWLLCATAN
jgi:hypothetical protein